MELASARCLVVVNTILQALQDEKREVAFDLKARPLRVD